MEKEKIINKLQKIYAMTKSSNRNESLNAIGILNKYLKIYNLSIEEISQDAIIEYSLIANKDEMNLLVSIIQKVLQKEEPEIWHYKKNTKKKFFKCTKLEFIEIDQLFDFHKKEIKELIKKTKLVYILKNNLYYYEKKEVEKPNNKKTDPVLQALYNSVPVSDFYKQIKG